ncbi:MAG: hypothetical protein PF569_07835 [Candidatus Woesearchaeota archaeon]|jgi:hypothetical protein|nr:hypothetical protein [Candidatus Woesearchaeota archaeon]
MGFFNKHKENEETKQTNDIKQATISDTQKSSMTPAPIQQEQVKTQSPEQQNFANPFANQNPTQTQNTNMQDEFVNPQTQPNMNQTQNANQFEQQNPNQQNLNQQQNFEMQNSLTPQNNNSLGKEEITEMIDETVEKLIEEKWDSMIESVNKIIKWKDITENQINLLKDDILNISEGFAKLESKLIGKISSYDKNILDVNSEIKALEKVFQKITPTLINNVNELSRIADNFKGSEPNKTKKLPVEPTFSQEEKIAE